MSKGNQTRDFCFIDDVVNGVFKSLNDFINRVDPKDVNKLQLEGLVKAGAFDKIDDNRKKIFSSIPKIISTIKSKYDEKTSNQKNLFICEDHFQFNFSLVVQK